MKLFVLPLVASSVLLLGSVAAWADVIPPGQAACLNASAGAPCTLPGTGAAGICTETTCRRLDYAGWDRDATRGPPSKEFPCLQCLPMDKGQPAGVTEPAPPKTTSTSNCNAVSGAGSLGALAFAGAFSLLFLLRRRRA